MLDDYIEDRIVNIFSNDFKETKINKDFQRPKKEQVKIQLIG